MNGRILDMATGQGVPFALLTTQRGPNQVGTQADADGRWSFAFAPGETVTVRQIGYQPAQAAASTIAPLLYLRESTTELPAHEVVGQRNRNLGWWIVGLGLLWYVANQNRR